MFEKPDQPLLPRRAFVRRMTTFLALAVTVGVLAVFFGALGYHSIEGMPRLEAALNSASIITGNGAVHPAQTTAGLWFEMADVLLGVVVFAAVVGTLLTPVAHRLLHAFHLPSPRASRRQLTGARRRPAAPDGVWLLDAAQGGSMPKRNADSFHRKTGSGHAD